ncbi:zinc finger protein 878-like [Leguminivora glycinivorella]|uniref:zinc finger protein 878-like n=1 Tax=Leguminivora glycinivorella TaxID=1035111 RepID=UPI0020108C81|nr:zinc finger protein 878-like [Leguminivora glycinivorella]
MGDLKICRICLRTECKVFKFDQFQLKSYYEEVMALKVNEHDGLPHYFCYECATMLHKFHKFKEKCYCGQKALREVLWRGPITYETIYKIDRNARNLQSPLAIMTVTDQVQSFTVTEEAESQRLEDVTTSPQFQLNPNSPTSVFVDIKNEVIKLEDKKIDERRKSKDFELDAWKTKSRKRTRFLDASNWKKCSLTEEEAVKEFRERAEEPKYLKASHKCQDCFKGFSKKEMLSRHLQLRHSESLGPFSCRLCRMRFKWESHLRAHLRQHFTEYRCQRCPFVCNLENSALLHEEYHSGITRKCIHCEEEFRHASTYYTHLRTAHRSAYVCTSCGASFVSAAGLRQHTQLKHKHDVFEESGDDSEVETYCERCDMRFESPKAFEEHKFHSVLHSEGVEHELQDEIAIPRKVLGKRLRAKITKELKKGEPEEDQITAFDTKRRKKMKRKRRKPTTCHQCGKHFETQTACMQHHLRQHPRTSFYPDNERHICEICGASLAPGSVAVHQNMHTRSTVFPCESCGRQFHSSVGLKRHLLTHTGEKPFQCNLCDKRFTQSNSMKLHYRTFHLKQPYPKRNRRKKKQEVVAETVDLESSSPPSPETVPDTLPPPPAACPAEPAAEPLTYLTLH